MRESTGRLINFVETLSQLTDFIMPTGFQSPITIKDAIDAIHNRHYLLPAIQRNFVWGADRVEMLFDSIMRDYPINSFMFWEVTDEHIKSNYKFYEFLKVYRQKYNENNPDINTKGTSDFKAVIDGQQRLTSLYIGLRGTYAYKLPRKWWYDNEDSLPTRKLYLELMQPAPQVYDNQRHYNFLFLSDAEVNTYRKNGEIWFEVGDILNITSNAKLIAYLGEHNLTDNDFAVESLSKLFQKVHNEHIINYYLECEQDTDKILEVFIRTNSGGISLSFSNLLMSIASANWKKIDARKEIQTLVEKIYDSGHGFSVNQDFILKTCLVLFVDNIRFQLKNFSRDNVAVFEDNWEKIKKSITDGFLLVKKIGFNDQTLRAKNAVIPIIYYLYYSNRDLIADPNKGKEDRAIIQKWLTLTLLKSIFGGQTDAVLTSIRKVIKSNITKDIFPFADIVYEFSNNPSKNYRLDDEFIDGVLHARYDDNDTFYILSIMYPDLDYYNQNFHKDHLHPKSFFEDQKNIISTYPQEDIEFCSDPEHWDSILNLQLLNGLSNQSKLAKPLKDWVEDNDIKTDSMFISNNTSLDIKDFKSFIEERRKNIKEYLSKILQFTRPTHQS